jgi:hypothetical protein
MGVLDDAIREHLELKRKHGVAEDELQRQEEEALGPARRDVAQQPEDAEVTEVGAAEAGGNGPAPEAQDTALFDGEEPEAEAAEPAPPAGDPPFDTPPSRPPAAEAPPAEAPPVEAPPAEPTPVEPPPVEPPPGDPDPDERPAHEPPAAGPSELDADLDELAASEPGHEPDPDDALGDTEPHGFDALDEDEDEEPIDDAELDVLEDTPDFLQETPEHDRLWFEQKPPRDFDFD